MGDSFGERVRTWREWAQFVYGGGGIPQGTDDELRRAVCLAHDREMQELRDEIVRLRMGIKDCK